MQIKELENEFIGTGEVKGFKFVKFKSSDRGFIYEVSIEDVAPYYEVFERKLTPICLDFENRVYSEDEFKEVYPKSKDFGKWAWGCTSLKNALKRFETLPEIK